MDKVLGLLAGAISTLKLDTVWQVIVVTLIGGGLHAVAKVLRVVADVLDKRADVEPRPAQDVEGMAAMLVAIIQEAGEEASEAVVAKAQEKAKEIMAELDAKAEKDKDK